jgi:tetratricopeptide (TPR) repeat protein
MTGNQPNRKDAVHGSGTRQSAAVQSDTHRSDVRRSAPGEKPVLNEPWDFLDAVPLKEEIRRRGTEAPPSKPKPKPATPAKTGEDASGDSRFRKAMRLFLTRRWEGALEEFLLIDAESFDKEQKAELAYYLGLCCTKLERFNDALRYLEQVIAIDNSPLRVYQCRMIIAYVYIVTDRASLAEAELNRLQGSGLESVMLYNTLAYSAYVQKHYLGAMEYYEKALEIDNDNTTALNSLGFILADSGFDKLKGLRLCRKAVDRNPENAAYLDSLGWASYKCGNVKDARKWLRQALDIAPQEAEIKKHFKIVTGEAV